jgi:hypothetical protein
MPRKALTGTQFKAQKQEIKFAKKTREEALRENIATRGLRRQSGKALKDIAMGKRGVTTDIGELMKQFQEAQKFAEQIYRPRQEEAIQNFQREVLPQISTQLGSDSKTSSALNQALAASAENLQRGISSDINNLSQNIVGQAQQGRLSNLQAMLGAAGQGLGSNQLAPQSIGFATAPTYLPSRGPSQTRQIIGGAIKGIGNFIGGGLGGGMEAYGNRLGGTTGIGQQGGGPNAAQLSQLAMLMGG